MTIAFISDMETSPWGGSEELWADTALHFRSQGHEVLVCVKHWHHREHSRVTELEKAGCRVIRRIDPDSLRWWQRAAEKIAQKLFGIRRVTEIERLVRLRPQCVVISSGVCWVRKDLWLPLQKAQIPYGVLLHVAYASWWPSDADRELQQQFHRGAQAVYFVSEANRRLVSNQILFDHPQSQVVRNPVNLKERGCRAWPDSSAGFRLAFVGRLEPSGKGCDLLLAVAAKKKWQERAVSFSFFGDGAAAQSVRGLAIRLGASGARFFGQVDSVDKIWADHHALILPSRYEGLPLVVIEAMLSGRMCIVTDVGGNTELLEDGVSGFFAEAATEQHLDRALERAWSERHRWENMGRAAYERASSVIPENAAAVFAKTIAEDLREPATP